MAADDFDPAKAPIAGNSPADVAAMRADMNKVAMKLHEAGIQLYGFYKIHDLQPYWNPLGFDFLCDNWRDLLKVAQQKPQLGADNIDMPGSDPWAKAGVKAAGFTQVGNAPHVHLDVAINKPGLCRLYIIEKDDAVIVDKMRMAKRVNARNTAVFRKIYDRLFALGLDLDNHIDSGLEALRSELDGINFVARNHSRLIDALTDLTYPAGGGKVFFRGAKSDRGHFAGNASFLATEGIGFRQIWRTLPAERPVPDVAISGAPAPDKRFAGAFGDSGDDYSSVHCAVSKRICNFHIDQQGFVIVDGKGNIIVDPDMVRHIIVELLWKTNLQGKLPFWMLDNVNFDIPSSPNQFARVGVSVDVAKIGRVRIQMHGDCSVDGRIERTGTLTLGFRF